VLAAGEKLQFIHSRSSSAMLFSTSPADAANLRVASREPDAIQPEVMHRFSDAGYVYRGRIALSTLPMFVKESTAGTAAVAAQAAALQAVTDLEIALIRVDNAGNLYQRM
jgi:hypothetical protein